MAENMILVEEARDIVFDHVGQMPRVRVPVWKAAGLPLAEDVVTDIDLSPFANSAMDGYAVVAADLTGASEGAPVELDVVGHEGADAVVKYEVVQVLEGDGNEGSRIRFSAPAKVGENIRVAGLEAHAGEAVLRAGDVVTPAGCGLLASAGASEVTVHAAPRVGIIALGTELVSPDQVPARGQIRDANSAALMAATVTAGAEPEFFGIAPDDPVAIEQLVLKAAETCDFVVTSGGASAGDYDYVTALVEREGQVLFDHISMKPGKAITFGLLAGKPFLGLSGNPAAAVVGFEMLARPAIRKMRGFSAFDRPVQMARVDREIKKRQARRFYNRAHVERDAAGELVVTEAPSQNSALLGTLQRANCLLKVADGFEGIPAGGMAEVVRIDIPEGTVL